MVVKWSCKKKKEKEEMTYSDTKEQIFPKEVDSPNQEEEVEG